MQCLLVSTATEAAGVIVPLDFVIWPESGVGDKQGATSLLHSASSPHESHFHLQL